MANTSFEAVYKAFLSKITDDMYMELFPEETNDILEDLMVSALPSFAFPKVDIFDYDREASTFNVELNAEEINIIAVLMVVEWVGQQLASVENTRMKYSSQDFKFTSQAAHMGKLKDLRETYQNDGKRLQNLYKRRKRNEDGRMVSTFAQIMEVS